MVLQIGAGAWNDWFEAWNETRSTSDSRRQADESRYRRFIEPALGKQAIRAATKKTVERLLQSLTRDGVGPYTVDATLGVMRGILGLAVEQDYLDENVARGVSVEGAKPYRVLDDDDTLTGEKVRALADSIDEQYRVLVLAAVELALTWSEALGLQVDDVDVKNHVVTVGRNVVVEANGVVTPRPGTKERRQFMSKELTQELAVHLVGTAASRDTAAEPWVFLTVRSHLPMRSNFNQQYWRPALRKAGLPTGLTFYNLRHTGIARMLRAGTPPGQVSDLVGYASEKTLRRSYGHFIPETSTTE